MRDALESTRMRLEIEWPNAGTTRLLCRATRGESSVLAVNHGGDSEIPERWPATLEMRETIESLADALPR